MIGCAFATPPVMPARTESLESLWSWQSGQACQSGYPHLGVANNSVSLDQRKLRMTYEQQL